MRSPVKKMVRGAAKARGAEIFMESFVAGGMVRAWVRASVP